MTTGAWRVSGMDALAWSILRAASAGVVATVAMSVPMLIARRLHVIDRQPPEEITQKAQSAAARH